MGRYIVVVGRSVVAALDELKKGAGKRHQSARDATRYLEDRFAKGDKWLQLQVWAPRDWLCSYFYKFDTVG